MTFSVTPQDFAEHNYAGAASALSKVIEEMRKDADKHLVTTLERFKASRAVLADTYIMLGRFEPLPNEILDPAIEVVVNELQSQGFDAKKVAFQHPRDEREWAIKVVFPLSEKK